MRLAYHVLDMDANQAKALASAIIEAKEKIGYCNVCFNLSDRSPCQICAAESRDHTVICVVEQPQDVAAMERMRDFRGVLSGTKTEEVIVATNPNVEGEATAMYLARLLKPLGVKVTRIAHGLPIGSDLEYADEVTLSKAMENRREME